MEIKITNESQLADYKRELERMEFQYSSTKEQINKIRTAIAEYERNREDARVAEIVAGLSESAKERMVWLGARKEARSLKNAVELESKGLESKRYFELTPLGLKVLAELQKPKPSPERWGVFGCGSGVAFCVCDSCNDIHIIADALRGHGYTVEVRKI